MENEFQSVSLWEPDPQAAPDDSVVYLRSAAASGDLAPGYRLVDIRGQQANGTTSRDASMAYIAKYSDTTSAARQRALFTCLMNLERCKSGYSYR